VDQKELLVLMQPDIARIDAAMRVDIALIASPRLQEILAHAVLSGGKRIRPMLAVLAARLCGLSSPAGKEGMATEVFRLAMGFEYLHAASLLHDDVIDQSSQRRGRATANALWGNPGVILAGDFLHARAMQLVGGLGGVRCLEILSRATIAMVEGEFLQAAVAQQKNFSEAVYFQVLRGKTGALIGAACEVGALYAGSNEIQQQALRAYGEQLGLAFQVVDDLLDYWGDSAITGKAVGNDLVEGKMTLPLLFTLDKAPAPERERLLGLLADEPGARQAGLDWVRQLMEELGAPFYCRQQAEALVENAQRQLEGFPESGARGVLAGLADYVLTRRQ
jgi:octaprenyl-diphosphate synthase